MSNSMATQQYLALQQQQRQLAEQQRVADEEKKKKEAEELTANMLTACTANQKASGTVLPQGSNELTETINILQQQQAALANQDSDGSSSADSSQGGVERASEQAVRGPPRGKAKVQPKPPPLVQNIDGRLTPFLNRRIGDSEGQNLCDFPRVTGVPWDDGA